VPYNHGCPVHDNPLSLLYMIPTLAEQKIDSEDAFDDYLTRIAEIKLEILESLGLGELIDFTHPKVVSILKKNEAEATLHGIATIEDTEDLVSAIVFGLGASEGTRGAVGHPCPFCQVKVLGMYEYKGQAVPLADFPIGWFRFTTDFEGSVGLVDVSEVEPNNFEIGTWIGWEDLSQAGRYQPGDPRNVVLNGALPQGNRGIVMFTEGFKNPKEARRVELEATQGKRVPLPAPLVGSLFIDEVLMINSNEAEYNAWISDPANEPYMDRYLLTWFKYPLEMDASREIFLAIWGETEFANAASPKHTHLDPMVAELAARLEILTRIEPAEGLDPNAKVDAYNGVAIRQKGLTKLSLEALRAKASPREGLTGNSPRELGKQVGALAAEALSDGHCVTARAFLQRLTVTARESINDEEALKNYMRLVNTYLDEAYRREASRMWLAACIDGFTGKCQEVFDKYLDNIQAFATHQPVTGPGGYTRVAGGGDVRFMREIESDPNWGVTESEAPKFRAEIMIAVNAWMRENKGQSSVPYICHEPVRRCIERYVVNQLRATARKLSLRSVRSEDDKRHLAEVVRRLVDDYNYCPHCANELLKEVEEKESFLIES
jgi:serine protein kinase